MSRRTYSQVTKHVGSPPVHPVVHVGEVHVLEGVVVDDETADTNVGMPIDDLRKKNASASERILVQSVHLTLPTDPPSLIPPFSSQLPKNSSFLILKLNPSCSDRIPMTSKSAPPRVPSSGPTLMKGASPNAETVRLPSWRLHLQRDFPLILGTSLNDPRGQCRACGIQEPVRKIAQYVRTCSRQMCRGSFSSAMENANSSSSPPLSS